MLQQPNGYVAVLEGQRFAEIAPGGVDTSSIRTEMTDYKCQVHRRLGQKSSPQSVFSVLEKYQLVSNFTPQIDVVKKYLFHMIEPFAGRYIPLSLFFDFSEYPGFDQGAPGNHDTITATLLYIRPIVM